MTPTVTRGASPENRDRARRDFEEDERERRLRELDEMRAAMRERHMRIIAGRANECESVYRFEWGDR